MKTVSMLDFRRHAEKIIAMIENGQRLVLTRRGKPVARLEPIIQETISADDPFYMLNELGCAATDSLSNAQIDSILYGP